MEELRTAIRSKADLETDDCEFTQASEPDEDDDVNLWRCIKATNPNRFVCLLCPKCGEQFEDAPTWQCHLEDIHFYNNIKMLQVKATQDGNRFRCKDCGQLYDRTEYRMILEHSFTHMPYSNYFKCKICDQTSADKQSLLQHIRRHYELHNLRVQTESKFRLSTQEDTCKLECREDTDYEQYLNFTCPICLCSVSNAQEWLDHVNEEHDLHYEATRRFHLLPDGEQSNPYFWQAVCKDCGHKLHYNDADAQLKHMLTHLRYRSFRCVACNLSMNYKAEIKLHMRWLHALPRFKNKYATFDDDWQDDSADANCSIWLTKEKIRMAAKYSDYLLYFCPSCSVELHDYNDWSEHILKNHDFFRPRYLAQHYSVLEDGKYLQCLICDVKMSLYANAYMRHYLSHMPYASHGCAICLRKSTNIYSLIKHLNSKHKTADGEISELWYFPNRPKSIWKRRKFDVFD